MLQPSGRKNIMTEQPQELREYLAEGEALVTEWYSREGVEESHLANLDMIATLLGLDVVMKADEWTFATMRARARLFLVAAFQMGRAAVYDDDGSPAE